MTDAATDGTATGADQAAAAAAPAAAIAATNAAAGGDNQTEPKPGEAAAKGSANDQAQIDPFAALDADNLTWFEKKHGKDPAKAVKQAYELDKQLGKSIVIPDETATDEQKAEFRRKLGVPDKEDGYGFKAPANLPPELPYDGEQDKAFAAAALKAGIPVAAANQIRDWFIQTQVDSVTNSNESTAEELRNTIKSETEAIVREWGPKGGPTFTANLEFADRFFTVVDKSGKLKGALQKGNLLGPKGEILNAALAFAFADAGRALFMEDGLVQGDANLLTNPFKKGDEFNFTAASQIVKSDPAKAKTMVLQAGGNLREWGLE